MDKIFCVIKIIEEKESQVYEVLLQESLLTFIIINERHAVNDNNRILLSISFSLALYIVFYSCSCALCIQSTALNLTDVN